MYLLLTVEPQWDYQTWLIPRQGQLLHRKPRPYQSVICQALCERYKLSWQETILYVKAHSYIRTRNCNQANYWIFSQRYLYNALVYKQYMIYTSDKVYIDKHFPWGRCEMPWRDFWPVYYYVQCNSIGICNMSVYLRSYLLSDIEYIRICVYLIIYCFKEQ